MACSFADSLALWQYMTNNMTERYFRGHRQEFLPKSAFEIATKKEVIQRIISQDDDIYLNSNEEAKFVTRVHREGRKFFAICVFCGLPMTCLKALLESGLTDDNLPLSINQCPGNKLKIKFVSGFLVNQKRFNTAYFDEHSIQTLDDRSTMPVGFNESGTHLRGKGAFGEVWEVEIHPDHRSFSSGVNRTGKFAMKVIQKSIQREKSFIRAMAGLNHSHLVQCLTAWTFDSKFYMIYELAGCNLEEFMKRRMSPTQHPGITEAMFVKQLCGLAAALLVIHCQGESPGTSGLLDVKKNEPKRTGYIHDLKPENILVFMDDEKVHSFRISDFSCAKVVDFVQSVSGKRRSHLTQSKSGTPIYRAPEAMLNKGTSRPYDLWSLGCVYLELLVWFFDGFEALEDFRNERLGLVHPHGAEDEGFYFMVSEGPDAELQLRDPVVKKIEELATRSQGSLRRIVDTIPSLLMINPERRPTAAQLVDKLKRLNTGADFTINSPTLKSLPVPRPRPSSPLRDGSDTESNSFVVVQRPTEE